MAVIFCFNTASEDKETKLLDEKDIIISNGPCER